MVAAVAVAVCFGLWVVEVGAAGGGPAGWLDTLPVLLSLLLFSLLLCLDPFCTTRAPTPSHHTHTLPSPVIEAEGVLRRPIAFDYLCHDKALAGAGGRRASPLTRMAPCVCVCVCVRVRARVCASSLFLSPTDALSCAVR